MSLLAAHAGMIAVATSGGGAPVAYRYIRIYITENNDDASNTGIGECIMALTTGGAQQASGGTASASSQRTTGAGSAAQAFDGNTTGTTNGWATVDGSPLPSWLRYDFGSGNAKAISEIRLYNQTNQYTRNPRAFTVQGSSDGSTWTDIKSFSGVTGWVNSTPKSFALY